MRRLWTDEEVAILRARWGKPVAEIAAEIGRSTPSIKSKAQRIGLVEPSDRTPLVEWYEVLAFVKSRRGTRPSDIASHYGVANNQAWQYLKRLERRGLVKSRKYIRGNGAKRVVWRATK